MVPIASIIVCSHNRADYIGRCLEGIAGQDVDFPFEVILVDNCSTDGTARAAEQFLGQLPLRIVHEPTLGLSHARNRGAREARSDIIIYVDDDAVAQLGWLREIVRCFHEITPRPAAVGGRSLLDWNGPVLPWVAERHYGIFGHVDLSQHVVRLDNDAAPPGLFSGCNFAVDRNALASVGGFSTKLGYRGKNLLGGEDTLVFRQLIDGRRGVYYTPDAVVRHIVVPERRARSYYAKRILAQGKANIAITAEAGQLRTSQIPGMVVREFAGLVKTAIRTGAYSCQLRLREAEVEAWESVRRVGRLMMLVEHALEPMRTR